MGVSTQRDLRDRIELHTKNAPHGEGMLFRMVCAQSAPRL
jgi:hypothetical protein